MLAIEAEVHHDVIAFLSMVAESVGDDARHLHAGMTSSDLVDTALALQLQEAGRVLVAALARLRRAAWKLAQEHRRTPMAGRSHGVHAEPITFGLKCLLWSEELGRALDRVQAGLEDCAVGKFSGAVGDARAPRPCGRGGRARRARAAPRAGREPGRAARPPRRAAVRAGGGGRHAGQDRARDPAPDAHRGARGRGAVRREAEGLLGDAAQAQPDPQRARCGLARLLRGYAQCGLENQALWHERDISHSSVERVILPDAFLVLHFMALDLAGVLEGLRVHPVRMRANLDAGGGLVFSQRVLLALTKAGMARDDAYRVVQGHALAASDGGTPFRAALEADPAVLAVLPPDSLAACFELDHYLRSVDAIFARAEEPLT